MKEGSDQIPISQQIETVLNAAQKSGAPHQRLAVELRKVQEGKRKDHGVGEVDETEKEFISEFIKKLNLVLAVKKKEAAPERILKFIVSFIHYGYKRESKQSQKNKTAKMDVDDVFEIQTPESAGEDGDTVTSRFTESIILHLLHGFLSKEKMVRLRCCQLVSMLVLLMKEIDEDLYEELVECLESRLTDKEAGVRANASVALSRLLIGNYENNKSSVIKLLDLLRYDSNAEVRRAIMLGIEINADVIPWLLERSHDEDVTNRKHLFLKVLPKIDYKILTIEKREELLTAGIRDRDPVVHQACIQLIATCWLKDAQFNLVTLFNGLDVINSTIADETIKVLLQSFPEIAEKIEFSESIWEDLQPESAFILRHTLEYFKEKKDFEGLEQKIPELLFIVKLIRRCLEGRTSSKENSAINNKDEELLADLDGRDAEIDFIVLQLILVTKMLDFMDELGRREMLTLSRKLLSIPDISEQLIGHVMDIVRKLSLDETDFTQITVEVISNVQQTGEEAQLLVNSEERRAVALLTHLKSLHIIKALLQRCYETLTEHSAIYALTQDYVSPALSQNEPALLKCAVDCLALCSLLDKRMAVGNAGLLIAVCQQGTSEFQINGIKALFDLAFVFGIEEISANLEKDGLASVFMGALENEDSEVQALAVEGLAKLLYGGRIPNASVILHNLAVLYFHVLSADNLELRQCLSYFFPAYCYSSSHNQKEMAKAIVPILVEYSSCLYLEWKKASDVKYQTPTQLCNQLLSWADPRAAFEITKSLQTVSEMPKCELFWFYEIGIDALFTANKYLDSADESSNMLAISAVIKSLVQLTGKLKFENLSLNSDFDEKESNNLNVVYRKLLLLTLGLKHKCTEYFASDSVLLRSIERIEASLLKNLKSDGTVTNSEQLFKDFNNDIELKEICISLNINISNDIESGVINSNETTVSGISKLDKVDDKDIDNEVGIGENQENHDGEDENRNEDSIDDIDETNSIDEIDVFDNSEKSDTDHNVDEAFVEIEENEISETIEYIDKKNAKLQSLTKNLGGVNGTSPLKSRRGRRSVGLKGVNMLSNGPLFKQNSELDEVRKQIDDILLGQ